MDLERKIVVGFLNLGLILFVTALNSQTIEVNPKQYDHLADSMFKSGCLPLEMHLPYKFENKDHNNTPDIIYLRQTKRGAEWYWNEFGCHEKRLDIPQIPFNYVCANPGDSILVPHGLRHDRYVAMVREPGVTEGMVHKLAEPLVPGAIYHLSVVVRSLSSKCLAPKLLVVGSKSEPCRYDIANLLHPELIETICADSTVFIPQHIYLGEPLEEAWSTIELEFIPKDTMHWITVTHGRYGSDPFPIYMGVEFVQIKELQPDLKLAYTIARQDDKLVYTINLTLNNPASFDVERPYFSFKVDPWVQISANEFIHYNTNDFMYFVAVSLPAKDSRDIPGMNQTEFRLSTALDCPISMDIYVNYSGVFKRYAEIPFLLYDQPFVYVPDRFDTLSAVINAGILPVGGISDTLIYWPGTLYIDSLSYTIDRCQLFFGEGAGVSLLPSSRMHISESKAKACGLSWEGFTLEKEATLNVRDFRMEGTETPLLAKCGSHFKLNQFKANSSGWDIESISPCEKEEPSKKRQ
jgi:hypothetical protein